MVWKNNYNLKNTWVDVETVATLKGISKRAVRLSLKSKKYEFRIEKIKGREVYKIKNRIFRGRVSR